MYKVVKDNLIMYSNVKSTGLPLGLFSTLMFSGNVTVLLQFVLQRSRCYCTLYLTARHFTEVLVDSFVLV